MDLTDKTITAAKDTRKTSFWVIASLLLGTALQLLADPKVIEVIKQNPQAALWVPMTNIIIVFLWKIFQLYQDE